MTLPRIGVFDSGVGGLTVLKAMAEQLPAHYSILATPHACPTEPSRRRPWRATPLAPRFLEAQNIDLLVIACNTATALALPAIQAAAHVPVVGVVEPGAQRPANISKNRAAIVIATEATVSSHAYRDALQQHGLQSLEKACPAVCAAGGRGMDRASGHRAGGEDLSGRSHSAGARRGGRSGAGVHALSADRADAARIVPDEVQIVDSAESTARVVKKMIEEDLMCHPERRIPRFVCHPERSEARRRRTESKDPYSRRNATQSATSPPTIAPSASTSPIRRTSSSAWPRASWGGR